MSGAQIPKVLFEAKACKLLGTEMNSLLSDGWPFKKTFVFRQTLVKNIPDLHQNKKCLQFFGELRLVDAGQDICKTSPSKSLPFKVLVNRQNIYSVIFSVICCYSHVRPWVPFCYSPSKTLYRTLTNTLIGTLCLNLFSI